MSIEKTVAFYTLGCKVNYSETSFIAGIFKENNYTIKKFNEFSQVYIINTCSVTATAVKKSRNIIHKAIRNNPDALIVITGCLTETEKDDLLSYFDSCLIIGANEKFRLFQIVDDKLNDNVLQEISLNDDLRFFSTYSTGERTRSFLKIQDGCNYFCSYCVIPYARGRSRSDYISNILENVRTIIKTGIKEIILTGINIGHFQNDKGEKLIDLLMALEDMVGLHRLRLSSIEPDLLHDDVIKLFSNSKVLMPHFHVPLQSGSDRILNLMNRRYNTAFFKQKIDTIISDIPNACVATDIITGFPCETEEDFENTYHFLENSHLSYFHVFPYSDRKQTKAFNFEGKLSHQTIKQRTEALLRLSETKKINFYNSQKGKEYNVLFESSNIKGCMYGFTPNYIRVKMPFEKKYVNEIISCKLLEIDNVGVYKVNYYCPIKNKKV